MTTGKGIDVCICTYNRAAYLRECMEALLPQLSSSEAVITIVDNNSSDETREYVESLLESYPFVRYIFEQQPGLSYARNRAWRNSDREWILYLDDDSIPRPGLLSTAADLIQQFPDTAIIGGPIYPVFPDERPPWLPEGFGKIVLEYETFTVIDKKYIRGVCFLVRKDILQEFGGFNPKLGMKAEEIAYGEELELQDKVRSKGYQIAYAPSLAIDHQIRTEKIKPFWILHSEYARRRDKMMFAPVPFTIAGIHLIRAIVSRIFWTPFHFGKALIHKKYSRKEALLDSIRPLAYRWGEFIGVMRKR